MRNHPLAPPFPRGQYLWLDSDHVVHAVTLWPGHPVRHRRHRITGDGAATNLLLFGGAVLALGDGALAHELSSGLDAARPVDLAGHARAVGAYPKLDRVSGGLHVLSSPGEPAAALHVISRGGLTRTTRSLADAPAPVRDVAFTRDRLVVLCDGMLGRTGRAAGEPFVWTPLETATGDRLLNAFDDGSDVAVGFLGPDFARINEGLMGSRHRFVYSVLATAVIKHDRAHRTREEHDFGAGRIPGEFLFVADTARRPLEDGGWLIGFVHEEDATQTELVVLDAADVAVPPVTAARIPRHIPSRGRGLWLGPV